MATAARRGALAVLLLALALAPAAVRADRPARGGKGADAASSAVFPLYGDVYPHGCVPPCFPPLLRVGQSLTPRNRQLIASLGSI